MGPEGSQNAGRLADDEVESVLPGSGDADVLPGQPANDGDSTAIAHELSPEAATLPGTKKRDDGRVTKKPPSDSSMSTVELSTSRPEAERADMEARIREATASGGLRALPPGFGDRDGDWISVTLQEPFGILYLDHAQASSITTEMVERHFSLISEFWRDKIGKMSQGATKDQMLVKYGGELRSEEQIKRYPKRLADAHAELASPGGIQAVAKRLAEETWRRFAVKLDERIAAHLADQELNPSETDDLLKFAEEQSADTARVVHHISEVLSGRGYRPTAEPTGASLLERLRSVSWVDPSRPQMAAVETPDARKGSRTGVLLVAGIVIIATLVASPFVIRQLRQQAAVTASPPSVSEKAQSQIADEAVAAERRRQLDAVRTSLLARKEDAESALAAQDPTTAEKQAREAIAAAEPFQAELKPELGELQVLLKRANNLRDRLIGDAAARRVRQVEEARAGLLAKKNGAESALAIGDMASTEELIKEAEAAAGQFRNELKAELESLAELRGRAENLKLQQTRDEERRTQQQKAWDNELSTIGGMIQDGKLAEASSLAKALSDRPGVPDDVVAKARALMTRANEELKKIFLHFAPTPVSHKVRP